MSAARAPTVQDIVQDPLTQLSLTYWAPSAKTRKAYDAKVIERVYEEELLSGNLQRVVLLELSGYLEQYLLMLLVYLTHRSYLWPNWDAAASSKAHLISIMIMVNEKFRMNVKAWDCFHERANAFPVFFERTLGLLGATLTITERIIYVTFLVNCFQSLEDEMLRKECLRIVSLPLWHALNSARLQRELDQQPKLARVWRYLKKKETPNTTSSTPAPAAPVSKAAPKGRKRRSEAAEAPADAKASESAGLTVAHDKTFIPRLLDDFLALLKSITPQHSPRPEIAYCERFVEFLVDLTSQLPTRRYFRVVLEDLHIVIKCRFSVLYSQMGTEVGSLFRKLVETLQFYEGFEINDYTGEALTDADVLKSHYERLHRLQMLAFAKMPNKLRSLALANVGSIEGRAALLKQVSALSDAEMRVLCSELALVDTEGKEARTFVNEVFLAAYEKRQSQLQKINELPLYPNEAVMWDANVVPAENYTGEEVLALPKLNLQFLTIHDYLLRNFNLFRLESAYEIREDLHDAVSRVGPRPEPNGDVTFAGWSRMALPIHSIRVTNVGAPRIGENKPSEVRADVTVSLSNFQRGPIREEWESLKLHDVLFLVTLRPPREATKDMPFLERFGVKYVRGAEVECVRDESGQIVDERRQAMGNRRAGNMRTFQVWLDTAQYHIDVTDKEGAGAQAYGQFNLLVRRKPKENNFKAILETIRDLMNSRTAVPDWLHDVFLGYGDPSAAQPVEQNQTLDYRDTFLSKEHLIASFPGRELKFALSAAVPPFCITWPAAKDAGVLQVSNYREENMGPYKAAEAKRNTVAFTDVQVQAVTSGMRQGLTLIVGPPGTGKTDVAVQLVANLYHNYPRERILLVTHSNQALNALFEKIAALDVDERHLLRLGQGAEGLDTDKDFTRYGRVDYMLALRLQLLEQVDKLAKATAFAGDVAYTCETASHFFKFSLAPKWEAYLAIVRELRTAKSVAEHFPLTAFFADAPKQPLFAGDNFDADLAMAEGCWRHVQHIFAELDDCRPFELLRTPIDRANYLVTKQARILAMTCTHAALKRRELVELGFKYDSVVMEEAGQILEIETFIPLLMQKPDLDESKSRLKRVVLLGDHNQLPPVVKNQSLQKYARLDQSLFARLVRLGVPTIDLNAQGRARPSLASLFTWRYKKLGHLSHTSLPPFTLANAGFRWTSQLIDVGDYGGRGEHEPNPHFFQNLGEAEYVVAVYQYMRLLGYPAEKISILTTYNGQKFLLRDVIAQRCAHPMFGRPHKVTTVDKFQGQQNDYILLSLVRTKNVGHLRDVRRLIVALSRARFGLYVFCRKSLFENCYELTPAFSQFAKQPAKLQLVQKEQHPATRAAEAEAEAYTIDDLTHMATLLQQYWKAAVPAAEAPLPVPAPGIGDAMVTN